MGPFKERLLSVPSISQPLPEALCKQTQLLQPDSWLWREKSLPSREPEDLLSGQGHGRLRSMGGRKKKMSEVLDALFSTGP